MSIEYKPCHYSPLFTIVRHSIKSPSPPHERLPPRRGRKPKKSKSIFDDPVWQRNTVSKEPPTDIFIASVVAIPAMKRIGVNPVYHTYFQSAVQHHANDQMFLDILTPPSQSVGRNCLFMESVWLQQ